MKVFTYSKLVSESGDKILLIVVCNDNTLTSTDMGMNQVLQSDLPVLTNQPGGPPPVPPGAPLPPAPPVPPGAPPPPTPPGPPHPPGQTAQEMARMLKMVGLWNASQFTMYLNRCMQG